MSISKVRGLLYRLSQLLGDVNAVEEGRVGKRLGRHVVGRWTARILGKLFRELKKGGQEVTNVYADDLRNVLRKACPTAFEIREVHRFDFYRNPPNGSAPQGVTLELMDEGPENAARRFSCVATSKDGRKARGNPGVNVEAALLNVHWGDLDRDK